MSEAPRILIVDDESGIRRIVSELLVDDGYVVIAASSGEQGLDVFAREAIDLVLLDLNLPGIDGYETAARLLALDPHLPVVILTAFGSIDSAVRLVREGVHDYLTKPFDNRDLLATVARALASRRLRLETPVPSRSDLADYGFDAIVTESPSMIDVFERMERVAGVDVPVLLTGESGTGKELVATEIHRHGNRHRHPMVAINCGAIPPGLVEDEFFGHESGAFTDARKARPGAFREADRGTLFLDEIAELPLDAQTRLLRVLQERAVVPVGATRPIPVDVRLIAATHVDLDEAVAAGRFRQDLYYRLNVVPIRIPPLRERSTDVPRLVAHFVAQTSDELGIGPKQVTPEAIAALTAHSWPGNVRELQNLIRAAMVLTRDETIGVDQLELHRTAATATEEESEESLARRVELATEHLEKSLILEALRECNGHRTQAAQRLGISRKTLFNKMKRYGLE